MIYHSNRLFGLFFNASNPIVLLFLGDVLVVLHLLARDLEVLLARGYVVDKVQCVDMFPNTVHVETIVALHRTDM